MFGDNALNWREGGVRAEVSRSYSANPSYEYTLQRQLQRGVRIA